MSKPDNQLLSTRYPSLEKFHRRVEFLDLEDIDPVQELLLALDSALIQKLKRHNGLVVYNNMEFQAYLQKSKNQSEAQDETQDEDSPRAEPAYLELHDLLRDLIQNDAYIENVKKRLERRGKLGHLTLPEESQKLVSFLGLAAEHFIILIPRDQAVQVYQEVIKRVSHLSSQPKQQEISLFPVIQRELLRQLKSFLTSEALAQLPLAPATQQEPESLDAHEQQQALNVQALETLTSMPGVQRLDVELGVSLTFQPTRAKAVVELPFWGKLQNSAMPVFIIPYDQVQPAIEAMSEIVAQYPLPDKESTRVADRVRIKLINYLRSHATLPDDLSS